MIDINKFAQRLSYLRRKANLTQSDIAKKCMVSIQAVSKWERGLCCPDLLILDDLGTEFDTPFYQSAIYNIINTRMNRSLPTIISTNMDWNGISHKYDERITSRIFATYVNHHFVGYDVRILKAQQKRSGSKN